MSDIKESQQTDTFSIFMRGYRTEGVLPSDEIKLPHATVSAYFGAIDQNVLVRLVKGKRLASKSGETVITYSPPSKQIYVHVGMRARVVHAVHETLGHFSRDRTYQTVRCKFDWPAIHQDMVRLVEHCANCRMCAGKAIVVPIAGHLRADRSSFEVVMGVLHLAKGAECARYMIIAIGVFSWYAVGTIVPDLKSDTAAIALRDDILKHRWGRPDEWVCDGASYFKT